MEPQLILQRNKYHLEDEREKFFKNICNFIDSLDFKKVQKRGRPQSNIRDILKAFLIMSYNGMSYRRTRSDLKWMFENELISFIPPRSTLNDYSNKKNIKNLLESIIQFSAEFFKNEEDTAILDSTWFGQKMYSGGYRKVYDKKNAPLKKVRKMHIVCLRNSKIISCAIPSIGSENDHVRFKELVQKTLDKGFKIKTLIADAGYSGKESYAFCKELGIRDVFIDFKKNNTNRRAKSDLWQQQLKLFREHKDIWHETYRFRVIVEGVFSVIKKKNLNYIRSKRPISQDVEVLLKALVYNLTIIGQYS